MCLLLVYVYSYGVFRQALFFSNKEPYWGVINDILYKPYWHVYGELFVEHQGGFPVAAIGCIPLRYSRLLGVSCFDGREKCGRNACARAILGGHATIACPPNLVPRASVRLKRVM